MAQSLDIMVALSGGVDSAVAALRLKQAGHRVQALHMTNWEDDDGYCNAAEDFQDARRVCQQLDIPLHRVNFSRDYQQKVFSHFLTEIVAGRTPNPDILCNREIKFGVFRQHAQRLGTPWMATGHYARLRPGNPIQLLKGVDENKDQTYFLHRVSAEQLNHVLFPVGELTKAEVRESAQEMGLSVAAKRDSTGICFIGERPFDDFLGRYVHGEPGPMLTSEGRLVGEHKGLPFYTIGQRHGLGLGGDASGSGEPWYVAAKHIATNTLRVVQGPQHPALFAPGLLASNLAWIGPPPDDLDTGVRLEARIRHRQQVQQCLVTATAKNSVQVMFDKLQRAIAPGQAIVFYQGDTCLGGGSIDAAIAATANPRAIEPRQAAGR